MGKKTSRKRVLARALGKTARMERDGRVTVNGEELLTRPMLERRIWSLEGVVVSLFWWRWLFLVWLVALTGGGVWLWQG